MYNKNVQVKANKKWRELNADKWNEINRLQQKKHYESNKDKINGKQRFKREADRLMSICIIL